MGLQTKERVGRGGFRGSPITDWCGNCQDYVVRLNNGECGWCCAAKKPSSREEARRELQNKKAKADRRIDAEIMKWRGRGMSHSQIGQMVGMDASSVRRRLQKMPGGSRERVAA